MKYFLLVFSSVLLVIIVSIITILIIKTNQPHLEANTDGINTYSDRDSQLTNPQGLIDYIEANPDKGEIYFKKDW